MKPKKPPPNLPERGEHCRLRGNPSATGVLVKFDPATEWSTVEWDAGATGPKLCHRFELERNPARYAPNGVGN